MIQEYDFDHQLQMSYGVVNRLQSDLLLSYFDARCIEPRANLAQDRNGIDLWAIQETGKRVALDIKAREKDFGKDDLALETWSVTEQNKVGWTRDANKQTDYIVWFWKDSRKYCVVPFVPLRNAFVRYYSEWTTTYPKASQRSFRNGCVWHSECVFVPRRVVWGAIYTMSFGVC